MANVKHKQNSKFQDFGDMTLRGDKGFGYVRLDWFTPDGLATWGDGRLLFWVLTATWSFESMWMWQGERREQSLCGRREAAEVYRLPQCEVAVWTTIVLDV